MSLLKVLVIGPVRGNYSGLESRLNSLYKQAQFNYVFCVGDFSGSKDLEPMNLPCNVYFFEGLNLKHKNLTEVAPKLFFLGKSGLWNTPDGLKVAFLAGTFDPTKYESLEETGIYNSHMVNELLKNQGPVDILITYDAPQFMDECIEYDSPIINLVALSLKPRYHFCAGPEIFFERKPYENLDVPTRFFSLAQMNNTQGKRWLYAFSTCPLASSSPEVPRNCTPNPFTPIKSNYVCRICNVPGHHIKECPTKKTTRDCWFCLDSPSASKNLTFWKGNSFYGAVSKGCLVPHHCLFVPLEHKNSFEKTQELFDAMNTVAGFYGSKELFPVSYEICRNMNYAHAHIQCIPVSLDVFQKIPVIFAEVLKEHELDYSTHETSNQDLISAKKSTGFYFEFVLGEVTYIHEIQGKFPLQIGREIMSKALGIDIKDWKNCVDESAEEKYVFDLQELFPTDSDPRF